MPKYVSNEGVWKPAKEKVALEGKNGPEIYEGDDRAALAEIAAGNITSSHFSHDPELIGRVRQIHNCSMDEYMKMMGYDEKVSKELFEKNLADVNTHSDPKRKPENRKKSGGQNTAGNTGHLAGDFGEPELKS